MINNTLSNLFKNVLTELGLVNTGALRDSIIVETTVTNNTYTTNVIGLDYLNFLVKDYPITRTFTNDIVFSQELSKLFYEKFAKDLKLSLNSGNTLKVDNPIFVITYNGV